MTTLTASEISQLIQVARKLGAYRFKHGDIEIEFADRAVSTKEEVDPKTGLTASESREWFASSEGG